MFQRRGAGLTEICEPGSLGEECQPDHASPSRAPWGLLGPGLDSLSPPQHRPLLWPHLTLQPHCSHLDCTSHLLNLLPARPFLTMVPSAWDVSIPSPHLSQFLLVLEGPLSCDLFWGTFYDHCSPKAPSPMLLSPLGFHLCTGL